MKWIDILFMFILVWSAVSTILLVHQFQSNVVLQQEIYNNNNKQKQRQLGGISSSSKQSKNKDGTRRRQADWSKKFNTKTKELDAKAEQRHKAQLLHEQQLQQNLPMKANQFPFTRLLETFTRSQQFFVYVVQNAEKNPGGLQWSEVRWKELVLNWGRTTTFDDLIGMTTVLHNTNKSKQQQQQLLQEGIMKRKLILHCLPKAASTTLRRACYKHMKETCPEIEFPPQQDPYGYRNVTHFFEAVTKCKDIDHFCIQGGDAGMSVINHEGSSQDTKNGNDDREPFHFIHMVPFRTYDEWVESAIKHIYTIDGHCNRINILLDECLGYRELYFELYPKSVLALLTGMTFNANGNKGISRNGNKGISSKDKHHILLYNYQDVSTIVTTVSEFFDIDPMPRTEIRHKEKPGDDDGTCPAIISEKFHTCNDETLMKSDAIRNLKKEKERRKQDDRKLKTSIARMRRQDEDAESRPNESRNRRRQAKLSG